MESRKADSPRGWFVYTSIGVFVLFLGVMAVAVVVAGMRHHGGTTLGPAEVQQMRYDASQVAQTE